MKFQIGKDKYNLTKFVERLSKDKLAELVKDIIEARLGPSLASQGYQLNIELKEEKYIIN